MKQNSKGKAQPKVQPVNNTINLTNNSGSRKRRRNRRRRARRSMTGSQGFMSASSTLLKNVTIRHRELWNTVSFQVNSDGTAQKVIFADGTYPPWFDKIRKLYEMYQLHYIRIFTIPPAPTTVGGNYVLSYNTNQDQLNDPRTAAQLAQQQNAKQQAVWRGASVVIPASALKNFRTNTACTGVDSNPVVTTYSFNSEISVTGNSIALNIPLWIEYVVTLRNPQV